MLRAHNIGLVVADTVEWPLLFDATSDFVYVRLHGSEQLYASGYEDAALDLWAQRVVDWASGRTPSVATSPIARPNQARCASPDCADVQPRDVFVYFDNDAKVRAPFDALGLRSRVDALLANAPAKPRRPAKSA